MGVQECATFKLWRPSYLLFGIDLRSPTDAALYPESPVDPSDVCD